MTLNQGILKNFANVHLDPTMNFHNCDHTQRCPFFRNHWSGKWHLSMCPVAISHDADFQPGVRIIFAQSNFLPLSSILLGYLPSRSTVKRCVNFGSEIKKFCPIWLFVWLKAFLEVNKAGIWVFRDFTSKAGVGNLNHSTLDFWTKFCLCPKFRTM